MLCVVLIGVTSALSVTLPLFAAQQNDLELQVKHLVENFRKAEQSYDAAALAGLTRDRYLEVSPAGEVDAHDRFRGFYTQNKNPTTPGK